MIALGDHVEIDLTTASQNETWIISRTGDSVYVSGRESVVTVGPAKPITLGRAMLQQRMFWPAITLVAHGLALSQVALRLAEGQVVLLLACTVGFVSHVGTLWPMMDAMTARMDAVMALNSLRVRYKMRTGEDA